MQKLPIPTLHNCLITDSVSSACLVMDLSDYLKLHPNMVFPHRHDFYHFVWFTSGSGSFTIDFEEFDLHSDQVYFMAPGQVHEWHFVESPNGIVVNFDASLMDSAFLNWNNSSAFKFFGGIPAHQVRHLTKEQQRVAAAIFANLRNHAPAHSLSEQNLLASGLYYFMCLLGQDQPSPYDHYFNEQPQILVDFHKLIEKYFKEKKLPKEYARLLNISANQLNSICQQYLQQSAGHLIRQRIVLEAKRQLIDRRLAISQIAFDLQFQDPSYFTKFFKKATDLTPEAFRALFNRS